MFFFFFFFSVNVQYWLESSVPRVPHKVQRALQRERVEREQKGLVFAGSSGVGGDYAKFEANFSRALTKGDTADAVHVKSRAAAGGGGGNLSSLYSSNRTNNLGGGGGGGGLETTKAVVVSDNLTATSPTPTGRLRKGFSVNLGAFSSASTVGSLTPPRGLATARDERGGGAATPRSASLSRAGLSPGGGVGGGASKYSPSSQVPLPPPSAATRCGDGSDSAALASPPPPPAKRFDWDGDGDGDQSTR